MGKRGGLKNDLARELAEEFDRYRLVEENGKLMVETKEEYIKKMERRLQGF